MEKSKLQKHSTPGKSIVDQAKPATKNFNESPNLSSLKKAKEINQENNNEFMKEKKFNKKWRSLRSASHLINRKGVGGLRLIKILKQEGIINEDMRPKLELVNDGLFRFREYPYDELYTILHVAMLQVSEKGIEYIRLILDRRDIRIEKFAAEIQKITTKRKVIICSKIITI